MAEANSTGAWRKSSRSASSECVEVQIGVCEVLVRNSNDRRGVVLSFSHDEWHAFLAGVVLGEFDPPRRGNLAGDGSLGSLFAAMPVRVVGLI
jgi:Domain of unknown function (DUF397)